MGWRWETGGQRWWAGPSTRPRPSEDPPVSAPFHLLQESPHITVKHLHWFTPSSNWVQLWRPHHYLNQVCPHPHRSAAWRSPAGSRWPAQTLILQTRWLWMIRQCVKHSLLSFVKLHCDFLFFNHRDLRNLRFILRKYLLLTPETLLLMMNKFFVWLVSTKYQQCSTDHCTQDNQVHALGWFSLVLCVKTLISYWNQTLIQIPAHSGVISVGFCLNSVKSRFSTFATPGEIKARKTTEAVVWTCCWIVSCLQVMWWCRHRDGSI